MAFRRLPAGYAIRQRRSADDAALLAVENRAAELFRAYGYGIVADAPIPDIEHLRRVMAGQVAFVAVDRDDAPVGFALAAPLAGFMHLGELSVDPAHGRKGLGGGLVAAVVDAGRQAGLAATSLTTFRSVPFNAPFYAGLGFAELPLADAPPALRERFRAEVPDGVGAEHRILMSLPNVPTRRFGPES